jgi:hypothetical protein
MNEILFLNTFFFTKLNVLTTKSHKLSMEIKCINPWRSGFGVTQNERGKPHYRLIQL